MFIVLNSCLRFPIMYVRFCVCVCVFAESGPRYAGIIYSRVKTTHCYTKR